MPTHRDIVRISAHSEWVGFANPCFWAEDAEIVRRGDRFELESLERRNNVDGPSERHPAEPFPVPPSREAVERLMSALERPPLEWPTLGNLGLDGGTIREEARRLLASPGHNAGDLGRVRRAGLSDEQIVEMLTEPQELQAELEAYFRGGWTDDHPKMRIRLGLAGGEGEEVLLESKSQMIHMLPWRIRMPGAVGPFETFEVEVAHALLACLPEGFLNSPRLLNQHSLFGPLADHLLRSRLWRLSRDHSLYQRIQRFLFP